MDWCFHLTGGIQKDKEIDSFVVTGERVRRFDMKLADNLFDTPGGSKAAIRLSSVTAFR